MLAGDGQLSPLRLPARLLPAPQQERHFASRAHPHAHVLVSPLLSPPVAADLLSANHRLVNQPSCALFYFYLNFFIFRCAIQIVVRRPEHHSSLTTKLPLHGSSRGSSLPVSAVRLSSTSAFPIAVLRRPSPIASWLQTELDRVSESQPTVCCYRHSRGRVCVCVCASPHPAL